MSSTDTLGHQLAPSHRESHHMQPAHIGNVVTLHHPFAVDMPAPMPSGSVSPPGSSCSTGTALGAPSCRSGTPAQHSSKAHQHSHQVTCHQRQQQGVGAMMGAHAAAGSQGYAGAGAKEWLYKLVTFPSYFTPCLSCCSGNRTPKREQLMTLFDTKHPHKVFCSHCPECQLTGGATLLQVRRASFKDVVKATDICRFGADVSGVQQYTLNGSKVIYLNREQTTADKKNSNASAAPAMCTVDGRAMMDKASLYCSLKCKMQAEDPGFTSWLDQQDPSVRILADIAANAPPRPTVACKRAAQPTSSGSSGSGLTDSGSGSGGSSGARPKKAARTASSGGTIGAAAGAPAAQGTGGESAAPKVGASNAAAAAARSRQRPAAPLHRAASASGPGSGMAGAPAGLKPIRTSLNSNYRPAAAAAGAVGKAAALTVGRQASAPSAFMDAAMTEPQLGHSFSNSTAAIGTAATGQQQQPQLAAPIDISGSSWLAAPAELDNALSSSGNIGSWESWGSCWDAGATRSPTFGLGVPDSWEEDGSLSPALITTAPAGGLGPCITSMGSTLEDWWLPTSPTGAFAAAGLAGF